MSKGYVLDASAILAVLHQEAGHEAVVPLLSDSCAGVVNLAEVYSKLTEAGLTGEEAAESVALLSLGVEPMDDELAQEVGRLRPLTRKAGLSLGDRSCLALAIRLGATVVTAERSWTALGLCPIQLIR
ncbi:PIN domain-containing protein [bacterium CPR1]|nr:PIN domain-containing protein [bacterium CPR1]